MGDSSKFTFQPLHFGDRLHHINPSGDVGVVTLWSRVPQIVKILTALEIDLGVATSRIAVIGNLYGNGLPHLLRNLLYNPQIQYLIILGQDLSGSKEDLIGFFQNGLEATEFLGNPTYRIKGRKRIMDNNVLPDHFLRPPLLKVLGTPGEIETKQALVQIFKELPPMCQESIPRVEIPLPAIEVSRYPSDPRTHTILRETPIEAWKEVVFRLLRFGYKTVLKEKGVRYELQNLKVVIDNPIEDPDDVLVELGLDPERYRQYQKDILEPNLIDGIHYSYGNRLRQYFGFDSLDCVIHRLKEDYDSRHCYISLWDTKRDTQLGKHCPCFVALYFRVFAGQLTLTANFRVHNAGTAWPMNVWGIIAIQRYVSNHINIPPGPITVISHFISLSEDAVDLAKTISNNKKSDDSVDLVTRKPTLRLDPNGEFQVTVDRDQGLIIAQHSYQGQVINTYSGKKAEELEREISRDNAVSIISHALYLGRELYKAQMLLRES